MTLNVDSFCKVLEDLRIPRPDHDTLSNIYDLEGHELVRASQDVQQGNREAAKYLKGIFWTVTPQCRQLLTARGMMIPPLKVLVEIGKREGIAFPKQLKAWDDAGKDGDHSRYVRLTYAQFLQAHASDATARGQNGARLASIVEAPARTAMNLPTVPVRENGGCAGAIEKQTSSEPVDPAGDEESARPEYKSVHIYGGKSAACFSADRTRQGKATVRIEAAESVQRRGYDWGAKIAIQLTSRELPLVLATLLQLIPMYEGKGHGVDNEKWFRLENQPGKVFLSVNARGKSPRGVPIPPGDAYDVSTLMIEQMLSNSPFLGTDAMLALVRKQADLFNGTVPRGWENVSEQRGGQYAN